MGEEKPEHRYLRKKHVMRRYGFECDRSVDRAWREYGTLPPPTIYQNRFPLWAESALDEHDRLAVRKMTKRNGFKKNATKIIK